MRAKRQNNTYQEGRLFLCFLVAFLLIAGSGVGFGGEGCFFAAFSKAAGSDGFAMAGTACGTKELGGVIWTVDVFVGV